MAESLSEVSWSTTELFRHLNVDIFQAIIIDLAWDCFDIIDKISNRSTRMFQFSNQKLSY